MNCLMNAQIANMNWWDRYDYFRDDYHLFILDNPGHGKSERRVDTRR